MNIAKRPARPSALSAAAAAELAYRALGFLAEEPDRIERFFSLTGVDPADLRALADQTDFQSAILDHLAGDEPLLIAFCEACGVAPEAIGGARSALGGARE